MHFKCERNLIRLLFRYAELLGNGLVLWVDKTGVVSSMYRRSVVILLKAASEGNYTAEKLAGKFNIF